MKTKNVVVLDFDDTLDEVVKKKVITKKESDQILEYMRAGLEGHYWEMYRDDVKEAEEYETEDSATMRKFYDYVKKFEHGDEHGDFPRVTFDCTVWS